MKLLLLLFFIVSCSNRNELEKIYSYKLYSPDTGMIYCKLLDYSGGESVLRDCESINRNRIQNVYNPSNYRHTERITK